jgi:hypothetical protein
VDRILLLLLLLLMPLMHTRGLLHQQLCLLLLLMSRCFAAVLAIDRCSCLPGSLLLLLLLQRQCAAVLRLSSNLSMLLLSLTCSRRSRQQHSICSKLLYAQLCRRCTLLLALHASAAPPLQVLRRQLLLCAHGCYTAGTAAMVNARHADNRLQQLARLALATIVCSHTSRARAAIR